MTHRPAQLVISLILLAPACASDPSDPAVPDPGGGGTGNLRGAVTTSDGSPADVDVAVLWQAWGDDGQPLAAGTVLAVDAPGEFTIDLSDPPPDGTLAGEVWNPNEPDQYGPADPAIAQGYIAALVPGTLDDPARLADLVDFQDPAILGWVDGTMLIYLADDVVDGSYVEQYVCGDLAAGYHVTRGELAPGGDFADCPAYPGGSEGASGAMMAIAPDDLDTELAISICGEECN
jgi:hypothetical protein